MRPLSALLSAFIMTVGALFAFGAAHRFGPPRWTGWRTIRSPRDQNVVTMRSRRAGASLRPGGATRQVRPPGGVERARRSDEPQYRPAQPPCTGGGGGGVAPGTYRGGSGPGAGTPVSVHLQSCSRTIAGHPRPSPWALSRHMAPCPRTPRTPASHAHIPARASAQVPAQTTSSIGTVELVQGAAAEPHRPSPSPALRLVPPSHPHRHVPLNRPK